MSRDTPASVEVDLRTREERRLAAVAHYDLADTRHAAEAGQELTEQSAFARQLTGAQGAAVNIIGDAYQQTIAGTDGVPLTTMDRDDSICGRVIDATGPGGLYITSDASQDPALRDSPWVSGENGSIRFYAGAALVGDEGLPLGMLCVFSSEPLSDEAAERAAQRLLPVRDSVVAVLEARRSAGHPLAGASLDDLDLTAELAQLVVTPRVVPIEDVIDSGAVHTLFQPIVHLESGSVVGFEALTRGPAGTELESPIALLDAARAVGRLGELDWLCRTTAMRAALSSALPAGLSLFVNVEPAGLEIECPEHLRPIHEQARAELRVVLEVVDREVEGHVTRLLHASDQARRDAWGVAVNDVGAGFTSLALLPFLQPDVVKLDMSLLHQGPTAAAADVTAAIRAYAERTGAVILAEGIETREHEEFAKVFGATYGQGYLYGHPAALPTSLPSPQQPIPLRQKPANNQDATPFDVLQKTITPQRGRPDNLMHVVSRLQRYCESAEDRAVMLALFDSSEQYLVNQARFDAVAERNALTVCLAPDIAVRQPNPRYHVGSLSPTSRVRDQAALLVITPHYAAALVIRHTGDTASDGTPAVDYIYTHDRRAVISAARAFLGQGV